MNKFVVALDPFSKPTPGTIRAMKTIRSVASQAGAKLQSVAVISPELISWPRDFDSPVAEAVNKAAEKLICKKQRQLKIRFDEAPETVLQVFRSTKSTMNAVRNFADSTRADVIAVVANVKTKQSAFGFISSLVSTSHKPVLAVNAKGPAISKVKTIVFASDYSDDCKKAFIKTLEFAKAWGARIVVVSKLYSEVEYTSIASSLYSPALMSCEPLMAQEETRAERESLKWQNIADLRNVRVDFQFTRRHGSVSWNVLRIAKAERADIIVVVAQTGKYASLILGSITRQLLAKSKTPILVMRDIEENVFSPKPNSSTTSQDSAQIDEKLASTLL